MKSGAIGMGTLTGTVGVVKTKDAKSGAVGGYGDGGLLGVEIWGGILVCWALGVVVGGGGLLGGGVGGGGGGL